MTLVLYEAARAGQRLLLTWKLDCADLSAFICQHLHALAACDHQKVPAW